ncbi:VOC family protein [Rhodococcus sp. G-MC3]|uniref:VOC family protein n=1 Tax=Rhodococcus sp. G-MC3 TaxID=3046209 RepID=UPI0024BAE234|nr:VOC family protein [Rhodococcus sp. G-MC3]MDJ0392427.1 VOC family protein [Rhodococcus sp. G-MC3]
MKRAEIYKAKLAVRGNHRHMNNSEIYPKLLVADAASAIDFYSKALDAELTTQATDSQGVVTHAELTVGSATLALAQSVSEWGWNDPHQLSGSPVLITINVDDPDSVADRMVQHGAVVAIPVEDRPYGKRQGRVQDPFGHLWVISGNLR